MRFISLCLSRLAVLVGLFGVSSPNLLASPLADRSENTAVILVHGWGHSQRVPYATWASVLVPYTDLTNLHEHYRELGFKNIYEVVYDDLASVDDMAEAVATQIKNIIAESHNPNLTLDIIGHSLGHYVAAQAILDERYTGVPGKRIADQVRIFIGLAGAVRGQDDIYPCHWFPGQCGGAEVLKPYYVGAGHGSPVIERLFTNNFGALDRLRKCSIYSPSDEIVKWPYNSASFLGLGLNPENITDIEINFRGVKFHKQVKDSSYIFDKMIAGCYKDL